MNLFAINAAQINGSASTTYNGAGAAAIVVAAIGDGIKAALGAGDATVICAAAGNATLAKLGRGDAALAITGTGLAYSGHAVYAGAGAEIRFGGNYGIPLPSLFPVPADFHAATTSRFIAAREDNRWISVPADNELLVARRASAGRIQHEGRSA